MPEARVRGVTLNYEVIGDRGPWVAFTPGSRRAYAELVPLSEWQFEEEMIGAWMS